ncbi:hypothetical protein C1645_732378 [Glomus cerebriforme]|uniref:BTB/POZ domain-containing protein n=1 Tax=Glomus cerebriforme TaxID=658196 RepID=A0A397TR78_9GLOM|nr:hypothetical protein C1645_732378 [Glomus cerebriforme]
MSFDYWQELVNDYEKLFENDKEHDTIIYVGENENIKEIYAHSNILCARSQYFYAELSNENVEKKGGKFILKKPNISPYLFKIILRYIYCGKIDLTRLEGFNLLKLVTAAAELNIQTLVHCIQNYLIEHEHVVPYQNSVEIIELTSQHELNTDLLNFYIDKICEEPEILFGYDQFIKLKVSIMEILLKRDDFCLEEILIWDSLIKWCLAQHPNISQDVKFWNENDIEVMKESISRFIPLIRFYQISSNDFFYKVLPYGKLLPKKLIHDILEFHLSSSKDLEIDCKQFPRQTKNLIDYRHFIIFASWIDKKDTSYYNRKNLPYTFNLLYRASRDGMGLEAFHEKCDNKEKTLVVAKVKDSEQLVGGYNPLIWDKNGDWKNGENSFLFSFENKRKIETAKLGINNNKEDQEIIGNCKFGNGPDLLIGGDVTWKCVSDSYSKLDTPKTFHVDDYEVFQVIKKNNLDSI